MSHSRALGWVLLVVLGCVLARWLFGPHHDSSAARSQGKAEPEAAPAMTGSEAQFEPPTEAERLLRCVDWGDLQNQFRIRHPRVTMKLDRKLSVQRFPALDFEVEAIEKSPATLFQAIYFDAEGARLGSAIVYFEPDYLTQMPEGEMEPPGWWPAGARSHASVIIPYRLVKDKQLARIVISVAN